MQIREPALYRQPSIRTYPMKKSGSAAALIFYGDRIGSDHTDSLEHFKKDFATIDREQREMDYKRKFQSLQRKKIDNLMREITVKQNQQSKRIKIMERQKISQQLYKDGELATTLAHGIPINPVSSQFLDTKKASMMAEKEHQKDLNRVVRSHYLHTLGNSGYNIINGRNSVDIYKYVAQNQKPKFQQKLAKLYYQRRINPQNC